MKTQVKEVNPVTYTLEIEAPAEELEPKIQERLKAYQKKVTMKGFRPGKVPLSLVRKLYGEAIEHEVGAEEAERIFHDEIQHNEAYPLVGQPVIVELTYSKEDGLRAVIQFEVLPTIELQDISDIEVVRPTHEVTETEVEEEMERIRERQAQLVPSEEPAGETDVVVVDIQELDVKTGSPILGQKQEEQEIPLDDPRLKPAFKEALIGKKAGDEVTIDINEQGEAVKQSLIVAPGAEEGSGEVAKRFRMTVREVKKKEIPALTDELIEEITEGKIKTVEEFREQLKKDLEEYWEDRARQWMESEIISKMLERHPIPVPRALVERFLDSFVEELKRELGGQIPPQLDVNAYRESRRAEAEQQARWMLIRDKVAEEAGLEVTEEDLQHYFEKQTEQEQQEELTPEALRQFYEQLNLMDSLRYRLLGEKVMDYLKEQVQVVEKPFDELVKAAEEASDAEEKPESVE